MGSTAMGSTAMGSTAMGSTVMSATAKLCGFLILLGVIFASAYAAGGRLGPVTTSHSSPARSGPMNMGAPDGQRH